MICKRCKSNFEEHLIEESHNVPCYLFIYSGNRQGKKNAADKFGREQLCKKHHDEYEKELNEILKRTAIIFSENYFKEDKE